jgi:hypothetical protein
MFPSRLDNRPHISTRQYRLLKPVAAKVRFGFRQSQSDRMAGLRKFEALQRFLCREGEPMAGLGNISAPLRILAVYASGFCTCIRCEGKRPVCPHSSPLCKAQRRSAIRPKCSNVLGAGRCCMEHEEFGTRPTRDRIQAVRWKLGRPSSVIRLRIQTPTLASVF